MITGVGVVEVSLDENLSGGSRIQLISGWRCLGGETGRNFLLKFGGQVGGSM